MWYLATVLDLKNKEVIDYEVSKNIDSELCKRALANALALRGSVYNHGIYPSKYTPCANIYG